MTEQWDQQMEALGEFIRSQRKLANLSLRQMAELTSLSNPYLSQLERGMHQPSVRVLKLISDALNLSAEQLLAAAGLLEHQASGADPGSGQASGGDPGSGGDAARRQASVLAAIDSDSRLDDAQKAALSAVYRSMLRS